MNNISKMPIIFVGHGSPMNAIEDNEFSKSWTGIGKSLPNPKAILCISAHWETDGTKVTAMKSPKTIHDFYGFPDDLYTKEYQAKGDTKLAGKISKLLENVTLDHDWGLDHGTWSVLSKMFPKANIPVVQLCLDHNKTPQEHFDLSKQLLSLREEGILIIGSGNIVHNLGVLDWQDIDYEWAIDFDLQIKNLIDKRDFQSIIDYTKINNHQLAIPTNEHYLPLLYSLALVTPKDKIKYFNEDITLGSLSMRSFITTI